MYPKVASYSVPRSALKTLQLRQKTYHWRIIGTAVGAVGGLIGALAAAVAGGLGGGWGWGRSSGAVVAGGIATAVVLPAAGYALGNAADKRTTDILIVP
jgi:hypothetical protein